MIALADLDEGSDGGDVTSDAGDDSADSAWDALDYEQVAQQYAPPKHHTMSSGPFGAGGYFTDIR